MADRKKLDDPTREEAYDPELDVNNRGYKPPKPAPRSDVPRRYPITIDAHMDGGPYGAGTKTIDAFAGPDEPIRARSYAKGGAMKPSLAYAKGGKVIKSESY